MKGHGFESQQERHNFFLQGQLSVLTLNLLWYPFHPHMTAVAHKRCQSFCQKCRWQVTAKHAYTLRMWLLLIEPCFGIGHNLSLICQMTSEDIKHQLIIISPSGCKFVLALSPLCFTLQIRSNTLISLSQVVIRSFTLSPLCLWL